MSTLQVIGIDLGKSNFHVYALASNPEASFKKLFSRKQLIEFLTLQSSTVVAFEACGGAHWLSTKVSGHGAHSQANPSSVR